MIEPRVAVLPGWHRLAQRTSLRADDPRDEALPRWQGVAADGATGPEAADMTELAQLIALGSTVAILAQSVVGPLSQDLTCLPVSDADFSALVVAWPQDSHARDVAMFVRAATTVAARRHPATP
jgi:hypothetical protein